MKIKLDNKMVRFIFNSLMILLIGLLIGVISLFWQFWLVFEIILYLVLLYYFSDKFLNLLNIHSSILSLLFLHAFPSTILILNKGILLTNQESLILFSSIAIGFLGYFTGVLFSKKLAFFDKEKTIQISKKMNSLFWLAYKHRYLLTLITVALSFIRGFTPQYGFYKGSVTYRMEVPGIIQYLNSLSFSVFSPMIVSSINMIGDSIKYKKLSLLSYISIIFVILWTIVGYRLMIVSLFVCLILISERLQKTRNTSILVLISALVVFILSGAIRYARSGSSFLEIWQLFFKYITNLGNMDFLDIMWGFSDFTIPFSTFLTVIKNVPKNIPFDYLLPIKDLSLLIPEIMFPGRPLSVAEWYVATFEPEIYRRGGGLTFYAIGYGYLFAGHIGVFLYLFVFGILFELLRKFLRTLDKPVGLFLYINFFPTFFTFVRDGEFFSFIKNAIFMDWLIPICLLFLFICILNELIPKKRDWS